MDLDWPGTFQQRCKIALPNCKRLLEQSDGRMHAYPWTDLEASLSESNQRLLLLGYGSLLNPDSARRTILDTPVEGHPAMLGFGASRVFNYVMPKAVLANYGHVPSRQRAALNTLWSGDPSDVITGRLLNVPLSDFPALRQRERGYHLGPVAVVPWDDPAAKPKIAYVLKADERPVKGVVHVDDQLLPHPGYLQLCMAGAKLVDDEFANAFRHTTWLGDRVTSLQNYLEASQG